MEQEVVFTPKIPVLDVDEDAEILLEFSQEAINLVRDNEHAFISLKNVPSDQDLIDNIFKVFHTIRGLADFLKLEDIECLSAETEALIDLIRKNQLVLEKRTAELIGRAADDLKKLLALLAEQILNNGTLKSPYYNIAPLIAQIRKVTKESEEKMDEDIRAAEALEKQEHIAAKQKNEFFTNTAHEIRVLLNAILGFSNLLSRTSLDQKQRGYVDTVVASGELLLNVVNGILDFSKIETGKLVLESIDFNLGELVSNVIKIVSVKIKDKPISITYEIADHIPKELVGDSTRLKQILMNLMDNAIKFTKEGEIKLTATLESAEKHRDTAEKTLRFSVKDEGIGLSEDKREKIFESFVQADDSISQQYGGTGLGLAISKKFVEAMGGKIYVESKKGKGSEFIFTVKLKTKDKSY